MWSDACSSNHDMWIGRSGIVLSRKRECFWGIEKDACLSSFLLLRLWKSALKCYVLPENSVVNTKCRSIAVLFERTSLRNEALERECLSFGTLQYFRGLSKLTLFESNNSAGEKAPPRRCGSELIGPSPMPVDFWSSSPRWADVDFDHHNSLKKGNHIPWESLDLFLNQ
jgi:hypothetical protein